MNPLALAFFFLFLGGVSNINDTNQPINEDQCKTSTHGSHVFEAPGLKNVALPKLPRYVYLYVTIDGKQKYINGRTKSATIVLADKVEGLRGTRWSVWDNGNVGCYWFGSTGGGQKRWLNGKTASGSLSLEACNSAMPCGGNMGGDRWKLKNLGDNKYRFESMGCCSRKYLVVDKEKFYLSSEARKATPIYVKGADGYSFRGSGGGSTNPNTSKATIVNKGNTGHSNCPGSEVFYIKNKTNSRISVIVAIKRPRKKGNCDNLTKITHKTVGLEAGQEKYLGETKFNNSSSAYSQYCCSVRYEIEKVID